MEETKEVVDKIEAEIQAEVEGSRKEINQLEDRKRVLNLKISQEQNKIKKYTELASNTYDREKRAVDEVEESLKREQENLNRLEEDYQKIWVKFEENIGKEVDENKEKVAELEEERKEYK